MSLKEVKERLRGVTLEKAVPLKVIGEVSYYLFEGGVLAVSNFEDRDLPYLRARTTVITFDELPYFLRKEVEEWLKG